MNNTIIYAIGFIAKLLFSARMIIQWIGSEFAGKVISPVVFWYCSLAGSFLLMTYGVCREDIVIVVGQFLTYYIYVRNLMLKGVWQKLSAPLSTILLAFPFLIFGWFFAYTHIHFSTLLQHKQIPTLLLVWGGIGQGIFTFRFVPQWLRSEKLGESVLPLAFWILSLIGSIMLLIYAVFRRDPVIFIGQLFGSIIYLRNISIHNRNRNRYIEPVRM